MLRNKFLIILYRGKDFLPCRVANLIGKRETELKKYQLIEEAARVKAIEAICMDNGSTESTSSSGTLSESKYIQTKFSDLEKGNTEVEIKLEAEKQRLVRELREQERKLFIVSVLVDFISLLSISLHCYFKDSLWFWQLNIKIDKLMKELSKLNAGWAPTEMDADREMITEEERECFQKIGLKMDGCLELGKEELNCPHA